MAIRNYPSKMAAAAILNLFELYLLCYLCMLFYLSFIFVFRTWTVLCLALRFYVLADRTNGRAIGTLLRPSSSSSVVCNVMYCG